MGHLSSPWCHGNHGESDDKPVDPMVIFDDFLGSPIFKLKRILIGMMEKGGWGPIHSIYFTKKQSYQLDFIGRIGRLFLNIFAKFIWVVQSWTSCNEKEERGCNAPYSSIAADLQHGFVEGC